MSKFVTALDTISGKVGEVPENYIGHPILGVNLVEVDPGTKDRAPEKHKAQNAEDYVASNRTLHPPKSEDKSSASAS